MLLLIILLILLFGGAEFMATAVAITDRGE
jgi:hypothetical protein